MFFFFIKKDEDNIPRIRSGLVLDTFGATVLHYPNLETISCEAVREISALTSSSANSTQNPLVNPMEFNALQWFNADRSQIVSFQFSTIQMSANLVNYTSLFPFNSSSYEDNATYQCCTVLDGEIVNCQALAAQIYKSQAPVHRVATKVSVYTELPQEMTTLSQTSTHEKTELSTPQVVRHVAKLLNSTAKSLAEEGVAVEASTSVGFEKILGATQPSVQQQQTTLPSRTFKII